MPGLAEPLRAPSSGYVPAREVIDLTLDDMDMDVDEIPQPQPNDITTQPNGLSPRIKKDPDGSQVTFVSTLAHRASSLSPQKLKTKALEKAGFNFSGCQEASPATYNHSPYGVNGDSERTYHLVSATVPQKRKSQSAEGSEINGPHDEDEDLFDDTSSPFKIKNGVASFSATPSLKALAKRPAVSPRTPSPQPQLPPPGPVSVVIPSPSAAQKAQMKAFPKVDFVGICERYFPTGQEERIKAQRRAYPLPVSTTVNRKVIPFTMTKPGTPGPKRPAGSLSVQKSVSTSQASALRSGAAEPMNEASVAKFLRKKLRKKLKRIPGGPETVFDIGDEKLAALSANFSFVGDYRLGPGVTPVDSAFLTGCDCGSVCDPKTCSCLIEEIDSDELIVAYERLPSGTIVLRKDFMDRKAMISECSSRCGCARHDCWNHVIQRGRQVRLQVFDTGERGLGLRCLEPLVAGQFIDCYWGEVITSKEADARLAANEHKPSYQFGLDWIIQDDESSQTRDDFYNVDGQKFGSATRFINHSCNPNCKIIPVSTNRLVDQRLYYLAFFATRDIPANEELTFDYHPNWEGSKDIDPNAVKCLCGEPNCRGQLWPNTRKTETRGRGPR